MSETLTINYIDQGTPTRFEIDTDGMKGRYLSIKKNRMREVNCGECSMNFRCQIAATTDVKSDFFTVDVLMEGVCKLVPYEPDSIKLEPSLFTALTADSPRKKILIFQLLSTGEPATLLLTQVDTEVYNSSMFDEKFTNHLSRTCAAPVYKGFIEDMDDMICYFTKNADYNFLSSQFMIYLTSLFLSSQIQGATNVGK